MDSDVWIPALERGETDNGPWEVFYIIDGNPRRTCLIAYGLDEETARTIAQRHNT